MVIAAVIVGLMSVGQVETLPHVGSLTDQLRAPARLAIASDGSVLVTDPLNNHIVRFDGAGALTNVWPVSAGPVGVAVHPDGRVFVSLRDEPKVAIYDHDMGLLGYLGADEPSVAFMGPTDIEIASNTGRIYVVDAGGDRIYGFEAGGTLALVLGSRGRWAGEFIYPSALTIDEARNRIIIADHDNFRLQVFTTAGVFLQQFGDRLKSPTLEGWMPRPQGLAVDANGYVYLTDALMGTVRVFTPAGIDLGKVLAYGYEPGQLRVPTDLAISNDGSRLYVVSSGSSCVEVYDLTGLGSLSGGDGATASITHEVAPVSPGGQESEGMTVGAVARETSWDGPHIVEDRRDQPCVTCHTITGQPGGHSGTVEGQGVLCMSCHSAAGRSLRFPIYQRDVADPFGTNTAAVDGRGRSHAWGVPAVNPDADAVGPVPGGMMSWYLDFDGNIKCATCHNQHNTRYGTFYLRVSNEADAMCKECHAPRNKGPKEGGSHPVGFAYPAEEGEYPAPDALGPLPIPRNAVECTTCHAPHAADSGGAHGGDGDGMLLRAANDETLCRICHSQHIIHNVAGSWQPTCGECHAMHDVQSTNALLLAPQINGVPVRFTEESPTCGGKKDFIHSVCEAPGFDGVCEVCHTDTTYHRGSPALDHTHYADMACTECHFHSGGFVTTCTECHGTPPDGTVAPNRAGSHAAHLTAVSGPRISDCRVCHRFEAYATHEDGKRGFASGVDWNSDGYVDLAETDVCDACHGVGGPFDGVNDPVIGAKVNWADRVYEGGVLKPEKLDWCAGCHDIGNAIINGIEAPPVVGDHETWGFYITGMGRNHVLCTDCHDPTLPHTDGVARTFSTRFPLSPGDDPEAAEAREIDKEAYNNGYRLLRIDGGRALEVPRDKGEYRADDFRQCFSCHDEVKLMGVPAGYSTMFGASIPPDYLRLPGGVAQTNYRNESPWGFGWGVFTAGPANAHWDHIAHTSLKWDIDHNDVTKESRPSCVTCHNPHGARTTGGVPTPALTMGDLAISFGIYNDGTTDYPYGYISSDEFTRPGGDLHCDTCHSRVGPGGDPPNTGVFQTRYYRQPLNLWSEDCFVCHETASRGIGASADEAKLILPGDGRSTLRVRGWEGVR